MNDQDIKNKIKLSLSSLRTNTKNLLFFLKYFFLGLLDLLKVLGLLLFYLLYSFNKFKKEYQEKQEHKHYQERLYSHKKKPHGDEFEMRV